MTTLINIFSIKTNLKTHDFIEIGYAKFKCKNCGYIYFGINNIFVKVPTCNEFKMKKAAE